MRKSKNTTELLSEDERLKYSWGHVEFAWTWRLQTCDPTDRPALQAKFKRRVQLQEEVHRRVGEVRWFPEGKTLEEIGQSVMNDYSPSGAALRVELGLPAGPTEEDLILAKVGDGYVTPAQRKRLRYLRKHSEKT